jgi:hypothetical protein
MYVSSDDEVEAGAAGAEDGEENLDELLFG